MSISGDCPKIKAFVQGHPFPERQVFLALLPTCPFQDVREGFLDFHPTLLEMEDNEDFFYNNLRSIYESYVDHEDTNRLVNASMMSWRSFGVLRRQHPLFFPVPSWHSASTVRLHSARTRK